MPKAISDSTRINILEKDVEFLRGRLARVMDHFGVEFRHIPEETVIVEKEINNEISKISPVSD